MEKLIHERDQLYCWHPFTQHQTECDPVAVTHGKGTVLHTEDGREILDLIASWWTNVHGHNHPKINQAIKDQIDKISHLMFSGFTHEPAVTLAQNITDALPAPLSRVFFSDNGSTANEVALKMSYQYWLNRGEKREIFLALDGGYHGDTFGAMSVGHSSGFFPLYKDLMCQVKTVPNAYSWLGDNELEIREKEALKALDQCLDRYKDEIAAFVLEPLSQGAVGMRFARASFVRAMCERVRAADIPVIFDEVATGFGRTGSLFAMEQIGFTPDIVCLSKGLTAGYLPMSLTITSNDIYQNFLGQDFNKALAHGHSFTGNPLACVAAIQSLSLFDEEQTLQKIAHINNLFEGFAEELQKEPNVERVRVLGAILAFNIKGEAEIGYKSHITQKLRDWYLANGLNIRPLGPVVYLMPPYCITEKELDRSFKGVIEGLRQL